jgi:hypothetical protein
MAAEKMWGELLACGEVYLARALWHRSPGGLKPAAS